MEAALYVTLFVGAPVVIAIVTALLKGPRHEGSESPDPHLFWVKGHRVSRMPMAGALRIQIPPRMELEIRQPFTPIPKRFTVCFKETEPFGEGTYRHSPSIDRVRLKDVDALGDFLRRLRDIERLYGLSSDTCYVMQISFLEKEAERDDLPYTIELN